MRTALYVRVSTLEQAESGYSIAEQTDRLKKFCDAKEWTVVKTYTDPGYSGANIDRPALKELIKDVMSGIIDIVLVYKLDRLSRSQKDTLFLIEDIFLKNKVEFVSMSENFDTSTPFGKAMIGILSVFAQLEREQIKERMAMGNIGRAKEGYWRGGAGVPIGYDFKNGELVINEYEAMQVREIFDLFLKGNTFCGIREIMSQKYTNKYSGWNNAHTVAKIITNPTYIGKLRYKGKIYEGRHQPIIDEETFRQAQARYAEIQKNLSPQQKSPYKGKHLLSGLLFCGNCGARYFVHTCVSKKYGTYQYYLCYSRDGNREMKKKNGCKNPIYKLDDLNNIIIDEILKLSTDKAAIEKIYNENKPATDDKLKILYNRIKEIDKQISKLMDLYQLDKMPIKELSARIEVLQEEKEKIEEEIKSISSSKPELTTDKAYEILSNASNVFKYGTMDEQKLFVNILIKKIIIYENEIKIFWKFY